MLAVFNKSIATIPQEMKNPNSTPISAATDYLLAQKFVKYYPQATTVIFGDSGYLSIDDCPRRRLIECHEDVFCLFSGKLENTENLRKYLNLSDSASDPNIITEIYKKWKKDSAHIVDSPLSEAEGSFSFILYDSTIDYVVIGVDDDGSIPLYWGTDSENNFVVTSFFPMAKQGCSRSYAPFPAGCVYTTPNGIMDWKHPLSQFEGVPWTDEKGQVCGVCFRISALIEGRLHSMCHYPKPNQ